MRTPLTVVTGIDAGAMAQTVVGLQWDLPEVVSVRHAIDPEAGVLSRVVSDASGVLERHHIELEHACISCALREDILPTLERLARQDRWSSILACLPVGAKANQLGTVLSQDARLGRHLQLANVVSVLGTSRLVDDLLGDELLRERGSHHGLHDARGVGEVACAMVEYADLVVLTREPSAEAHDLVRALARPGAAVIIGSENLAGATAASLSHDHSRTLTWARPVRADPAPPLDPGKAWRLELHSLRPFDPDALLDRIDRLGAGRHRSRGCFWLPTRPGAALHWDGAGGQLSIGTLHDGWSRLAPRTQLLFTGVGAMPAGLAEAFEELLVADDESARHPRERTVAVDGLEPWLGPILHAA